MWVNHREAEPYGFREAEPVGPNVSKHQTVTCIPSLKRKFQVPMLHAARSLNSHSTGTGTLPLPYRR